MERWLDFGSAGFAFVAAVFWFLSAYGPIPHMMPYWGYTPDSDAFYQTLMHSAQMNRWAAAASCVSALLFVWRTLRSALVSAP